MLRKKPRLSRGWRREQVGEKSREISGYVRANDLIKRRDDETPRLRRSRDRMSAGLDAFHWVPPAGFNTGSQARRRLLLLADLTSTRRVEQSGYSSASFKAIAGRGTFGR